jgi:chromosome segregation ATPase
MDLAGLDGVMMRIEQFRGELLERLERVDRRLAQNEQRVGRIDQRLNDIADRMETLRQELLEQLELLAAATVVTDSVMEVVDKSSNPR